MPAEAKAWATSACKFGGYFVSQAALTDRDNHSPSLQSRTVTSSPSKPFILPPGRLASTPRSPRTLHGSWRGLTAHRHQPSQTDWGHRPELLL